MTSIMNGAIQTEALNFQTQAVNRNFRHASAIDSQGEIGCVPTEFSTHEKNLYRIRN